VPKSSNFLSLISVIKFFYFYILLEVAQGCDV